MIDRLLVEMCTLKTLVVGAQIKMKTILLTIGEKMILIK